VPKQASLKAKLVRIGNSQGVRLPKAVIEQAGLTENLAISVVDNQVIITPAGDDAPRAGWAASIRAAVAKHGHDVDEAFLNMPGELDEKEWTW